MTAAATKTETLYTITAIIRIGPRYNAGSRNMRCEIGEVHSCALAFDKEEEDPEWAHTTVDLKTVNEIAAESDDAAATLAEWGVWTTTDRAKALRALARARRSAYRRWDLPKDTALGVYAIGS